MPEVTDTGFLSIGEVLGLLLEEFPDITISKIRFLESQGLISPERTASGYRKFYNHDVELLKVILTEQRRNYLPLRVIKDRLDSGEIDRTGEHNRPERRRARACKRRTRRRGRQPRPHSGRARRGGARRRAAVEHQGPPRLAVESPNRSRKPALLGRLPPTSPSSRRRLSRSCCPACCSNGPSSARWWG